MAATETKLFIPQENDEFLYIARNFPADKDLLVVVLYHCDNYLHFLIVGGNGSGRVHPIYMPFTADNYLFCFHAAINAIATVDPEMAETLYTDLQQKSKESKERKPDEFH